jgi:hypothetical protein
MMVTVMVMVAGVPKMIVVAMVVVVVAMEHLPDSTNKTDSWPDPDVCKIARTIQTASPKQICARQLGPYRQIDKARHLTDSPKHTDSFVKPNI